MASLTGIAAIGGGTATIGRGSPMVQLGGTGGQGKQGGHTNKSLNGGIIKDLFGL